MKRFRCEYREKGSDDAAAWKLAFAATEAEYDETFKTNLITSNLTHGWEGKEWEFRKVEV